MEVLDVLPHVSQTIDAFCGAKPKDFVVASRCKLDEGLHVGGAPVQESFGSLVQLLWAVDQLEDLKEQRDGIHFGTIRRYLAQEVS